MSVVAVVLVVSVVSSDGSPLQEGLGDGDRLNLTFDGDTNQISLDAVQAVLHSESYHLHQEVRPPSGQQGTLLVMKSLPAR